MKYRTRSKKTSWQVDQDYFNKLSPDMQDYLQSFNQAYYGANTKAFEGLSDEMKSEIYSRQYSQRQDALNNCCQSLDPFIELIITNENN